MSSSPWRAGAQQNGGHDAAHQNPDRDEPAEPSSDDDQDGISLEMQPVGPDAALDGAEPTNPAPGTQPVQPVEPAHTVDEDLLNAQNKGGDKAKFA